MKTLQVRHVPEEVHRTLKARAASAGRSLSDYVLEELTRLAERPTRAELYARILETEPAETSVSPAEVIRQERDSR